MNTRRPDEKEIVRRSRKFFDMGCDLAVLSDVEAMALDCDPQPKRYFDDIKRNYPGWTQTDFEILYAMIAGI